MGIGADDSSRRPRTCHRARFEQERQQLLEREQAARGQAEEASRLKDEFLAVLSHELRTPLNAILGWAQILRGGGISTDRVARALGVIERNARTQAQLIGDLLDLSRIITGHLRLHFRPVQLAQIVKAAIDVVHPAADNKDVSIDVSLDASIDLIGDAERLQQVTWNLLSNAVKFTLRHGRVQVALTREGSEAIISVKDTGEGISPQFLPYVFERFRQANGGITRAHGGLGLGLAIVRQLTEAHGGTVHAKSPGIGSGATFTIRLPIRAGAPLPLPRARAKEITRSDLQDVHVLVVDDDADARELLSVMLEQCKASVSLASSAAEGLALLQTGRQDLLIADIGMPEQDGYDLIRAVRRRSPAHGGRIPSIAVTAYAGDKDQQEALAAGYDAHVPKPVEADRLYTVIANLLGKSAAPG